MALLQLFMKGESWEQKENLLILNTARSNLTSHVRCPSQKLTAETAHWLRDPGFILQDLSVLLFSIINEVLSILLGVTHQQIEGLWMWSTLLICCTKETAVTPDLKHIHNCVWSKVTIGIKFSQHSYLSLGSSCPFLHLFCSVPSFPLIFLSGSPRAVFANQMYRSFLGHN